MPDSLNSPGFHIGIELTMGEPTGLSDTGPEDMQFEDLLEMTYEDMVIMEYEG